LLAKIERWYDGGPEVDRSITERFSELVEQALRGELDDWGHHPAERLALILVLDQFTRTVYRNTPRAFAGDMMAQRLAVQALDAGWHHELGSEEKMFLIMPLVHAERRALQERACALMQELTDDAPPPLRDVFAMGIEQTGKYCDIITRFGRFPHRNAVLGRESTPEELEFLRDWEAKRKPKSPGP
jgi:uncharacterized protein (DUF924 family)